jgi:hypothetical protein
MTARVATTEEFLVMDQMIVRKRRSAGHVIMDDVLNLIRSS